MLLVTNFRVGRSLVSTPSVGVLLAVGVGVALTLGLADALGVIE